MLWEVLWHVPSLPRTHRHLLFHLSPPPSLRGRRQDQSVSDDRNKQTDRQGKGYYISSAEHLNSLQAVQMCSEAGEPSRRDLCELIVRQDDAAGCLLPALVGPPSSLSMSGDFQFLLLDLSSRTRPAAG